MLAWPSLVKLTCITLSVPAKQAPLYSDAILALTEGLMDCTIMNCCNAKMVEPVATNDTVLDSLGAVPKSTIYWPTELLLPDHTFS